ncbi:MAG: OmpH family outer membrane protein [Rikenellaceae bacterium]|nr:OmpH family outer membrane protein [Rikenellaceae bacterium]
MKKLFKVVLAFGALFLVGNASSYAQKFGYINFAELVESMPEMTQVRTNFETFQKDLEDQYETMAVEFNNKYNDFVQAFDTLSETIRQMREEEINSLRERLTQFEQNAGVLMQQEQSRLMTPLIEKAQETIQKVSKANSFTAVFELTVGALAYYDESTFINILPMVQSEMGI